MSDSEDVSSPEEGFGASKSPCKGVEGGNGERESVCVWESDVESDSSSSCLVRKPSISLFRSRFPTVTLLFSDSTFTTPLASLDSPPHVPNDPSSKTTSLENPREYDLVHAF